MSSLKQITVQGYKSIQSLENFALKPLNILIGANGAGKSNFISLFKLLANIEAQSLQIYTQISGGPDSLLFYGRQLTNKILMKFDFGLHGYGFNLIPTADNRLIFESESLYNLDSSSTIAKGNEESQLRNTKLTATAEICSIISNWKIYHFHDTSDNAKVKQLQSVTNNLKLQGDASNLAPYLKRLQTEYPDNYHQIVKTIQMVAPFFKDFVFREQVENIELEWAEIKNPDQPFKAYMLSDGTLRFICLTTLLLQPYHLMPEIILIDEPELGLHPYAINLLSSLIQRASDKKQLIISSQSVDLIDNFNSDDLVIFNHENNRTVFNRLDNYKLKAWLEEYSLSELWKSNLLGGRPSR
jgi:predicted ATPase